VAGVTFAPWTVSEFGLFSEVVCDRCKVWDTGEANFSASKQQWQLWCLYYMPSALHLGKIFNLTKLNQYITLPCNTINHFSSQLFLRQENLLQNNSVVQENLTCIFMELHPPRRPMMCHDRIVCKIKPHKLRSDFIS